MQYSISGAKNIVYLLHSVLFVHGYLIGRTRMKRGGVEHRYLQDNGCSTLLLKAARKWLSLCQRKISHQIKCESYTVLNNASFVKRHFYSNAFFFLVAAVLCTRWVFHVHVDVSFRKTLAQNLSANELTHEHFGKFSSCSFG